MTDLERDPERLFAAPAVELERRRDGTLLLRCAQPLGRYARCVGEFLERWGMVRFTIAGFLLVLMMSLPVKMFLRLAFNVKYVLVTPWINI